MARKRFMSALKEEIVSLKDLVYNRVYISKKSERNTVNDFHRLYYNAHRFGKTWKNTSWLGVPVKKCPFDLWVYQEIILEIKPDVIIESGTLYGGSALFLASLCDLVGCGKVLTIDIEQTENLPRHKRIKYLHGSSTDAKIVQEIKYQIRGAKRVMVILDSDHSKSHVLNELRIYGELVALGSYIIVEDTNVGGHPVYPNFGPGPMEAIEEFLKENRNFVVDLAREKFYLTFNPRGYLKKVR